MMKTQSTFPELLQAYFMQRLMNERNASPHTIANYRDAFRLLIAFAHGQLRKPPTALTMQELDASFVCRFLDHLERDRGVSARSRNVRLAAIHSFFNYVALQEPALGALAQRVLAIKSKRYARKPVDFLTRAEAEALLSAPNQETWSGRRDRTLLLIALQTGMRVSELISLRCQDVTLDTGAHVRCIGKGRKPRCIPLRKETVTTLRVWLRERNGQSADALFPNARGKALSRDGIQYLLAKHVAFARQRCPTLKNKRVSPHVLRHYLPFLTMSSDSGRRAFKSEYSHQDVGSANVSPDIVFSALQAVEEPEELIAGVIPCRAAIRRCCLGERLLLHSQCRL
jgi:integrase/recombinase XerD